MFGGRGLGNTNDMAIAKIIRVFDKKKEGHFDSIQWAKLPYEQVSPIEGRSCHKTVTYRDQIFVFGGHLNFNEVRSIRQCPNHVLRFDVKKSQLEQIQTKGLNVQGRKFHTACLYKHRMVVFGGCSEREQIIKDMNALNLETLEWSALEFPEFIRPTTKGAACTVIPQNDVQMKKKKLHKDKNLLKIQHGVEEGIYYFGGKNKDGEATNKLKILKLKENDSDNLEVVEFRMIKPEGRPPCKRYGH